MIQIKKINGIYPVMYLGIPYTVVETDAVIENDKETVVLNFGTEALARELLDINYLPKNKDARLLDDQIYGYFPEELLKKPETEFCSWISENFD